MSKEGLAQVKEAWAEWREFADTYYVDDAVKEAIATASKIRELPNVRRTHMSWGAIENGELHANITVMITVPSNQKGDIEL